MLEEDEEEEILICIVRGPPPSYKTPILEHEIEALARRRPDVAIRVGETGTALKKDMIVTNPLRGARTPILTLFDGRLQAWNPDRETLEWMLSLADDLRARVSGPGLESYRTPTETYVHPEDVVARKALLRTLAIARNPWIPDQTTVIKWAIMGFFALLALMILWVSGELCP